MRVYSLQVVLPWGYNATRLLSLRRVTLASAENRTPDADYEPARRDGHAYLR